MRSFLSKFYILVGVAVWVGALGFFWVTMELQRAGWLPLLLALCPFIVAATILASRGFRQTTTLRVLLAIYAVFLVPTGLMMFSSDVIDNMHAGNGVHQWVNTGFWFSIALEGGLIVSPVVWGLSAVIATINNQFAER